MRRLRTDCETCGAPLLARGKKYCSPECYHQKTPAIERFLRRVEKTDACWNWLGKRTPKGYGSFELNGKTIAAHRYSYERSIGPVPAGMQLDHLCRNRACVNPSHLEPVTSRENTLRGDHPNIVKRRNRIASGVCENGHPASAYNPVKRRCMDCWRASKRESSRRKREMRRNGGTTP